MIRLASMMHLKNSTVYKELTMLKLVNLETRNGLTAHYFTETGLHYIAWQKAAIEALNEARLFSYI